MDLARIGVLLIGIALMVFAVLAVVVYLDTRRPPGPPAPLSAYCQGDVVVISAGVDLRDVKVVDVDGRVYCVFDFIKAGSDKLCKVGEVSVYLVVSGDFSRAVLCHRPIPPAVD
jgi:hypothetical protein